MKPIKLKIKTKTQKYSILIGKNLAPKISAIIKNNSIKFNKCLLVIDKNVPNIILNKFKKSFKNKKIFFLFITVN